MKPSYGLSEEQVEAMIKESYDKAEEDMRERQVREARVEADNILLRHRQSAEERRLARAFTDEERAAIESAKRDLLTSTTATITAINDKIEALNKATMSLAENMMNTAVRGALKGTKID